MTDLSGNVVPPPRADRSSPAVPPAAFDDEEPWPVPDAAPNAGGMVRFAGLILGLTGIWHAVAGLVALTEPAYFATATSRLPIHVGYTTWGVVHLVVGLLAVAAGVGVVAGNRLASVVAVVIAVLSAVVSLVFMRAEPGWSFLMIGLDVIVIWGVTTQAPPPRHAG